MKVIGGAVSGADLRGAREEGLRKNQTRMREVARERDRLAAILRTHDSDGDGKLTPEEFTRAIRRVDLDLSEKQARAYTSRVLTADGAVAVGDFCDKFVHAADSLQVSQALKTERWQDNGDILSHHYSSSQGERVDGYDFNTTNKTEMPALSPDGSAPAGTHSSKFMYKDRVPMLFAEWDSLRSGARRGRGVSAFQSQGLRFDERGFQAGTGRAPRRPMTAELPREHRATMTRPAASVRECLQPDVMHYNPIPAPTRLAPTDHRVLHFKGPPPPPGPSPTRA
mmetsp:Transcript_5655/g.16832  ORF Transcript_5655/g.16832 Transcript_5655/m.16832 type:complete len:282 (-) Transcript_5655:683-1528(-)